MRYFKMRQAGFRGINFSNLIFISIEKIKMRQVGFESY